jgi:glycopeptide antibiotics resistance protein
MTETPPRSDEDRVIRQRRLGIVLSALTAMVAGIPWGTLQDHPHWGEIRWVPFVSPPVGPLDITANILLFAPLGYFLGVGFVGRRRAAVAVAAVVGLVLSLGLEFTQIYSHGRYPSTTDLASNVIGAVGAAALASSARTGERKP